MHTGDIVSHNVLRSGVFTHTQCKHSGRDAVLTQSTTPKLYMSTCIASEIYKGVLCKMAKGFQYSHLRGFSHHAWSRVL